MPLISFPKIFSSCLVTFETLNLSANALNLNKSENLLFGKDFSNFVKCLSHDIFTMKKVSKVITIFSWFQKFQNKSTAHGHQRRPVGCLIEDKKSKQN